MKTTPATKTAESTEPKKAKKLNPDAEVHLVALHTVQRLDEFGDKLKHRRGDLFVSTQKEFDRLKATGAARLASAAEVKAAGSDPIEVDEEEENAE